MKKSFRCFFPSLMLILTASCGDDDKSVDFPDLYLGVFTYGIQVSEDMLDAYNITVYYYQSGAEKSEKLSAVSWSKTMTSSSLPDSTGFAVAHTLKSGLESGRVYVLATAVSHSVAGWKNMTIQDRDTLNDVKDYILIDGSELTTATGIGNDFQMGYRVDADGTVSKAVIPWSRSF